MSWQAAGVSVPLIARSGGLILGFLSWRLAGHTNTIAAKAGTSSRQAVEKADTANRLAERANEIAERSVKEARRSADEAATSNRLQHQSVSLQANQQFRDGEARLEIARSPSRSDGFTFFMVTNHGPSKAYDLEVEFVVEREAFNLGALKSLNVGQSREFSGMYGYLFGPTESMPEEDETTRRRIASLASLNISFTDGNQRYRLPKLVHV